MTINHSFVYDWIIHEYSISNNSTNHNKISILFTWVGGISATTPNISNNYFWYIVDSPHNIKSDHAEINSATRRFITRGIITEEHFIWRNTTETRIMIANNIVKKYQKNYHIEHLSYKW